jgi:hypothetical protein
MKSKTPIGTSIEFEKNRLEQEIAQHGIEAVKELLRKEAVLLDETNKKTNEINKKAESFAPLLAKANSNSPLKERIQDVYDSIQREGLDYSSNMDLYELQATLIRRKMVVTNNPELLNIGYNDNVARAKQ